MFRSYNFYVLFILFLYITTLFYEKSIKIFVTKCFLEVIAVSNNRFEGVLIMRTTPRKDTHFPI